MSRVLSLHNSTSFFIPITVHVFIVLSSVCTGVGWKCLDFDMLKTGIVFTYSTVHNV